MSTSEIAAPAFLDVRDLRVHFGVSGGGPAPAAGACAARPAGCAPSTA